MTIEYAIIIIAWIITIILLIKFIPKDKIREALVVFMFKQLITWSTGLIVVELRLIEYPVRLFFQFSSRTSFTFEYFIYPSLCAIFNLNYPDGKSKLARFRHYFNYCSSMTVIEVIIEKYTNIIKYVHWSWYTTWITLFITFYISRKYYLWFFKLKEKN